MEHKTMGWNPESTDTKIGKWLGVISGMIQFILNINLPVDIWSKLIEAAITAIVCGLAGVLGKDLYKVARSSIVSYFRNKKNKKS